MEFFHSYLELEGLLRHRAISWLHLPSSNEPPGVTVSHLSQYITINSYILLVSINKVTLHWTRLVHGWVTVCMQVNHVGM